MSKSNQHNNYVYYRLQKRSFGRARAWVGTAAAVKKRNPPYPYTTIKRILSFFLYSTPSPPTTLINLLK